MEHLKSSLKSVIKDVFGTGIEPELTRPDEQFGDYATNVALQLAGSLQRQPREIAEQLSNRLRDVWAEKVSEVSVAGPGFINIRLSDDTLWHALHHKPAESLKGQVIVAEYSDPNPFKVLHAGHIYTTVVGDAIARLLEAAGANVHRVNYGGDVGLHVAKTMWAILKKLGGANIEKLLAVEESRRAQWLAEAYIEGTQAYEYVPPIEEQGSYEKLSGQLPKVDIILLNQIIYGYWRNKQYSSESRNFRTIIDNSQNLISVAEIYEVYEICRQWSYEAFDAFYARFGTKMEKYYPESEVAELGLATVRDQLGKVFEESEGAIIFRGEQFGLHTRVFINREGLPTYEAKEVGLLIKKHRDYHFDRSFVVTGNEQQEYMAVVLKAIEQFLPDLAKATIHIPHGMVKLAGGVKMSSRRGNFIPAHEVLDLTAAANKELTGSEDEQAVLAAVKYAFLKNRIGGDIIYDPAESVSILGNSGPYLQYAHARARSILSKADFQGGSLETGELEAGERSLLRKISEYPEVADKAVAELMPHHICTYLYELAQKFNNFYEHNRVISDQRQDVRLKLVDVYAETLKNGLALLNIPAPEKM